MSPATETRLDLKNGQRREDTGAGLYISTPHEHLISYAGDTRAGAGAVQGAKPGLYHTVTIFTGELAGGRSNIYYIARISY
jgi:hypothetical protein